MNPINQYYEILGLKPGASQEEVKQAYRNLAKTWHPDRFGEDLELKQKAEEKIKEIIEAYQHLKSYQPSSPPPTSETKIHSESFTAEIYYNQGVEKARIGRYQEAIEDFTRAIRFNPQYAEAYEQRGRTCSELGYHNRDIELWQTDTGEAICTLRGHSDAVYSIAFSPDGQTLASTGVDGIIKLWQVGTGQEICTLTGHSGVVYTVAFSPDGKTLVSGSHDKTVKIWQCD